MKTKLIKLAKKVGFGAVLMQNVAYKAYPDLEPTRYYLWMCELQKWCREECDMLVLIESDMLTYDVSIYGKYALQEIRLSSYLSDPQTYLFTTYEQALEEGLYQTLLLIQEKNGKEN